MCFRFLVYRLRPVWRLRLSLLNDNAFGVVGRFLLALDLVFFDLLLAGPLLRGLWRLVTHDRLPQLKSIIHNGAHQGEGHPAQS